MSGIPGVNVAAWRPEEDALMHMHFREIGARGLESLLKRNRNAIGQRAAKLGLTQPRDDLWSDEEIAVLTANYATKGGAWVAEKIGRPVSAVTGKARRLKVRGDRQRPNPKKGQWKKEALKKPSNFGRCDAVNPPKAKKLKHAPVLAGEADYSRAKRTTAPVFVDTRFVPTGPVPRVVNSAECRDWAKA